MGLRLTLTKQRNEGERAAREASAISESRQRARRVNAAGQPSAIPTRTEWSPAIKTCSTLPPSLPSLFNPFCLHDEGRQPFNTQSCCACGPNRAFWEEFALKSHLKKNNEMAESLWRDLDDVQMAEDYFSAKFSDFSPAFLLCALFTAYWTGSAECASHQPRFVPARVSNARLTTSLLDCFH